MDIRNNILNYVCNSEKIDRIINNVVDDKRFLDDFKQHFFIQILEMKEDKLLKSYLDGYLDKLCTKIIINQWRSKTSSFYYLFRKRKYYLDDKYSDDLYDIEDKVESNDIFLNFKYETFEKILNDRYTKFIDRQYHITLFRLYYKEIYNYRQISEMTNININTIAQSITKSVDYIKNKIKDDNIFN